MRTTLVSESQLRHYRTAGYVTVSGLLPEDIVTRARTAMRKLRETDRTLEPNRTGAIHKGYTDPDLMALYTPELYSAIAAVTGIEATALHRPECAYTITVVPSDDPELRPFPHLDGMTKETLDPGFQVTVMTYLSEVSPNGGGTLVWPGSHRIIGLRLNEDPDRYPTFDDLQKAVGSGEFDLGDPVELTAMPGDVAFIDCRMVHAGGINRNGIDRLALNWKW